MKLNNCSSASTATSPLSVRRAVSTDLPRVMGAIDHARGLMRACGNFVQWTDGYPSAELMAAEIEVGHCFVCVHTASCRVVGTFCFIRGEDPTYAHIEQGRWLNDEPYAAIHRLATDGTVHGVARACLEWCASQCANLRVDTHQDNAPMQHILEQHGFVRCGIIRLANGSPRIAYQRIAE